MTQSKKVFLAASAFVAFVDRANPKHEEAIAFFRYFAQEGYILFSDNINVITAYNNLYRSISPSLAKDFLRSLSLSDINILYPEESDAKAALKALVTFQTTELTYQEALMSVLANRRSISQIYTLDYLHQLFGISLFYLPL